MWGGHAGRIKEYSKEKEIIKRVGGAKGGHWEVIIKK